MPNTYPPGMFDADPPIFTDPPPMVPDKFSSAARMVRRRDALESNVQEARELDQLADVAEDAREDQALADAIFTLTHGGTPKPATRVMAVRALERRGDGGRSSAEEMAATYLEREQAQKNDRRRPRRRTPKRLPPGDLRPYEA